MKKISKPLHLIRSFAMVAAIALVSVPFVEAQVSVNAPSGLMKRSGTGEKKSGASEHHENSAPQAPAKPQKKAATAKKHSDRGTAVSANGSVSGVSVVGQYSGYRVQVLFTSAKNGRALAQQRAKKIALKYPQYRSYMSYVAPRWRLRFGDFKTYNDASYLGKLIKRSFPEMRADVVIVTDKVNKFK